MDGTKYDGVIAVDLLGDARSWDATDRTSLRASVHRSVRIATIFSENGAMGMVRWSAISSLSVRA
jgi:hypothetical protein